MEMRKLMSLAIAFAMLAVSFAMVGHSVKAQITTATDNSTHLTVNAAYPKLYTVDLYENDFVTIVTDTQIDPLAMDYFFGFEFNYSLGSANCEFLVQGWYDFGVGAPYPGAPGDPDRNTAFEIHSDFNLGGMTTTVNFPAGDLEITSADGQVPTDVSTTEPAGEERYLVFIPVTFGPQIRAADYGGVAPSGAGSSIAPANTPDTSALDQAYTWDFSVTVYDSANLAAAVVGFNEFGIYKMVSLTCLGNPSGAAPPGSSTGWMLTTSSITYSSNTDYYMLVEVDDLYDGTSEYIFAENVQVQNMHADAAFSNIGVATYFANSSAPLYVWGTGGAPVSPSNHGTTSAGPLDSNYLNPGTTTELQWQVDVPAGTSEGIYTGTIYVTIIDSDHPYVTSTTPADHATAVPTVAGTYVITFSEPMDIVNNMVTTDLPGAVVSWNDPQTMWITYSALSADTVYHVDLTGWGHTDAAGTDLAGDMVFEFVTAP